MPMFTVLGRKDPNEVYPYQYDVSAELASLGDTLDGATADVVTEEGDVDASSDLEIVNISLTSAGIITFYLSGGSANSDGSPRRYYIRIRWTGANTTPVQTIGDKTFIIPVGHR